MSLPPGLAVHVDRRRASGVDGAALRREAEILAHARHPGVIELVAVRGDDAATEIDTAPPDGAPLRLVALTVEEVAGVVASVATTVADLHDIGVAHGRIGIDAVTIDADGRAVLHDFTAASWLDGPPTRWPSHAQSRADDRCVGDLLAVLLERCAPQRIVAPLERPSRWARRNGARVGSRRRAGASDAARVSQWAARASAGGLTSRRLAEALATEVPGARLPTRTRVDQTPATPGQGPDRSPDDEVLDRWFVDTAESDDSMPRDTTGSPAPGAGVPATGSRTTATRSALVVGIMAIVILGSRILGGAGHAAAATPDPGACVAGAAAPCATYRSGILTVDRVRYAVGAPGDVAAIGRWDCAAPTLALLRPASGSVWVYRAWPPGDAPLAPAVARLIPGARSLAVRADHGCDTLVVVRDDGAPVTIPAEAGR